MPDEKTLLEPGNTYIIDEPEPCLSVTLFEQAVRSGRAGLFLSSEPRERARARLGNVEVDTAWVTDVSAPGALKPAMLDPINALRERFMDRHPRTVVLFDIYNALASANDFNNVFKFFSYIRDDSHHRDSINLISLDSAALKASEFRMVRRLARDVLSNDNRPDSLRPAIDWAEGSTYIFASAEARAYRVAAEAGRAGRHVMVLTRDLPDGVRQRHSLHDSAVVLWLSRTKHQHSLRPDGSKELFDKVAGFMGLGKAMVVLDGLDILMAELGFNELFSTVSHMKDQARMTGSILLIVAPKGSLSAEELRKFSHAAEVV